MRLTLEIECTTPAFEHNAHGEAAEVMRQVAAQIACGNLNPSIVDADGEQCGRFIVTFYEQAK